MDLGGFRDGFETFELYRGGYIGDYIGDYHIGLIKVDIRNLDYGTFKGLGCRVWGLGSRAQWMTPPCGY